MNLRSKNASPSHDHRIDQVLRHLGSAMPTPGIEDRISGRLARDQSRMQAMETGRVRFFGIPRFAIGAATAGLACVAIVAGSVNHSHRIQPMLPGFGPQTPPSSIGAAGAERPAQRPVEPPPNGRPRSVRRSPEGRAVISPQSQKPTGVAVPKSPSPAQ
jgi:hypothetical protein